LRAPIDVALGQTFPPPLRYGALPVTTVIKGDRRCATIAAASVLAKVHRDAEMVVLDGELDAYGWASNKGYGAPLHLEALRREGPSSHHRQSWSLPEKAVS
jgi:ribonuclease HII